MNSPSSEHHAKAAFFQALEALNQDSKSDDDLDANEQERVHRQTCRAFFESATKPRPLPRPSSDLAPDADSTSASQVPSVPILQPKTTATTTIDATPVKTGPSNGDCIPDSAGVNANRSLVEESPVIPDSTRPKHPSLRRSTTLPTAMPAPTPAGDAGDFSPSAAPDARKKRKRKSTSSSIKTISEAQQVLRGLVFYYIPNNDISPVRKMRIARAVEYGALWARTLAGSTHVIVDKNLTYKDIKRELSSVPLLSAVIVNEDYPITCIDSRRILNPSQYRFRVDGIPAPAPLLQAAATPSAASSPQPSQSSGHSLVVKAPLRRSPRKRGQLAPEEVIIPSSNSIESSLSSRGVGSGKPTSQIENTAGNVEQNITSDQDVRIPAANPSSIFSAKFAPHASRSSTGQSDELTEYIKLAQQFKDLPLDEAEDDTQSTKDVDEAGPGSGEEGGGGSDDEQARKKRMTRSSSRKGQQKSISFEDRFACNKGGTKDGAADAANPNARTMEVLQSMCDYYSRIEDQWRTFSYRKAIATLRRQTTKKISTAEEARQLPNIGARLAAKIEEIATTDRLRRLEYASREPTDRALQTFLGIYGVGASTASKWVAQGFRTLDDLVAGADLTRNQRLGIERYADLNTRIPRADVTALGEYVQREARAVDPHVELLVGGSYRRGAESSGDVDFIVTRKGTTSTGELVPFLEELLAVLERKGCVVATLTALHSHRASGGSGSKWHGCCVLPREDGADSKSDDTATPIWRRVDFLLVPETEYGAALIYFTGNDIFNRSLRLLASKKGMRLNQRGLYRDVIRGPGRKKITEGELAEGRDERRIFEILGVKWREPWERWC